MRTKALGASRASLLFSLKVIDQILQSRFFRWSSRYMDSAVSPLFERMMTMSSSRTVPRSPWTAVLVWRNVDSNPKDSMVPTNFSQMGAFLPKPVMTTLPPLRRTPTVSSTSL